jgi:hypothetical protein
MDSTQAPVIIFVVPVLHASARKVFTVSCFAPRAHPKQLQTREKNEEEREEEEEGGKFKSWKKINKR